MASAGSAHASASARSCRTLGVHSSHANASTRAGLPRDVAPLAICAAARVMARPPAQPTPCSSMRSTVCGRPSRRATSRSYPGLPWLVHVTATVCVMSEGRPPHSLMALRHACAARSTPARR